MLPPALRESGSVRHLDVEQRRVLLCAEDVRIAGTAARTPPIDRELDGVARIELDEVGDPPGRDPIQAAHRFAREYAGTLDTLVRGPIGEDHVERDEIDASVLAANRLRELGKLPRPGGHRGYT